MISSKMYELGSKRSSIRELFEYGKMRAEVVGAENIFDFSLGNPTVPAPSCIKEAILDILENEDSVNVHGYTSAQGDMEVRKSLADFLNNKYELSLKADNFYMTYGAASSLSLCFKALTSGSEDEYITIAPFFPEYKVFVEASGAKLVVIPPDLEDFQINLDILEKYINKNTKGIIINSPNNPSGVVYSEEIIINLCKLLREKSEEYGQDIYLISDEPYREIAYDNIEVPFLTKYYNNTLVCYSFSKSLSLPGERIGYVILPDEVSNSKAVYAAICGAGRTLGYVCAPSLFQKVIAKCIGQTSDISEYQNNRDLLYENLTEMGYECVKPQGAFYLFVKTLEEDSKAFCEKAKELDLLLVEGDNFGCPGYVRISYCVSEEMIKRSFAVFEKLSKQYKLYKSKSKVDLYNSKDYVVNML